MQSLWRKRFFALIIDIFVITLVTWIIGALLYPLIALAGGFGIFNYWVILAILLIIGYFTYLEGNYGTTFGKTIMKIKVTADEGEMDYQKALIRNLSKILWVPLILDVIVGYFYGDSKIRYLDKVAGTDIIGLVNDEKNVKGSSKEPAI
jgi:uncharacterized RDD family membrane protein YckC